jgi:predicted Zn-dependent protease
MHVKKLALILGVIFTTQFASCANTTAGSVAGVNRSQFMLLPESQVVSMSKASYTQTLQEAGSKKTLNTNQAQYNRVLGISNRLIAQVGIFRPDAAKWAWEVNVETNEQVNAYCMPGGKIMVFTGLIDKLQATDDELAAVIGHEIAHALREHGRERMSQALVQQVGIAGLGAYLGTKGNAVAVAGTQAAAMGTSLFFALPNGREQEREADKIGLELAARAGYNPDAAVTLWQKMAKQGGEAPSEFFSTHPSNENRIADLKALAPKVRPLYEAAKKG